MKPDIPIIKKLVKKINVKCALKSLKINKIFHTRWIWIKVQIIIKENLIMKNSHEVTIKFNFYWRWLSIINPRVKLEGPVENRNEENMRIFVSSRWSVTHLVKIRTKIEMSSIKTVLVQNWNQSEQIKREQ